MGETVTIVVRPARRDPDHKALRFDAFMDGKHLCQSHQPFLDGCRELLARGYSANAVAQMQHEKTGTISLRAKIGAAAAVTVVERDKGKPARFESYHELPAEPAPRREAAE